MDDLTKRAIRAYLRAAAKVGSEAIPGASSASYNGVRYILLTDFRGKVTVYRMKPDGYLRRLKRWPKVLAN